MAKLPPSHPLIVWFCGRPGSGKSTLAKELHGTLTTKGIPAAILDADLMRCGPMLDLEYNLEDRWKNMVRLARFAHVINDHGTTAIVAAVTPLHDMQRHLQLGNDNLVLVSLVGRRHKPLWKDTSYEEPTNADIIIDTTAQLEGCIFHLLECLDV